MTKTITETLLFATVAINAALLLFIAGVLRRVMNEMDEAAFKNFMDLLVRFSSKSPFMIIALNLPLLGAIPYYCFYGSGNWWVTTGLALWLVVASIAKTLKLPVYKAIAKFKSDDSARLIDARQKMNGVNLWQAAFYTAAVVLMAFGLH